MVQIHEVKNMAIVEETKEETEEKKNEETTKTEENAAKLEKSVDDEVNAEKEKTEIKDKKNKTKKQKNKTEDDDDSNQVSAESDDKIKIEITELKQEDDFEEEPADNLSLLKGVGEVTAEKLREAGYTELMAIAASSAGELVAAVGVGEDTANKIIASARANMEMGFETASDVMKKRESIGRITTGSTSLDTLIGGGIETQSITEAHGAFGSGKSQLAHQLALTAQLPIEKGGLGGKALFIDSEGTFRPERIKQMAEALEMDPDVALHNVLTARAYNSDHQMLLVEKSEEVIKKEKIKILIIDSLTSHFRADYTGRGTLANRQQKMNRHLHKIQRLADVYNMAVYITNQVMSRPDVMFGDPTSPIGGHILGHQATFRLYLRKSKAQKRVAKLIDSPNLPEGETIFIVNGDGIRDV